MAHGTAIAKPCAHRPAERKGGSVREIKFRAWDRAVRQMCIVRGINWLEGEALCSPIFKKGAVTYTWREIEDFTLMQFTGILDKNKKEIYEGDILKCHADQINKCSSPKWRYSVISVPAGFVLVRNDKLANLHLSCNPQVNKTMEIIGNIYENADLLKEAPHGE